MFVKLFGDKLAVAPIEDMPIHQVLDLATGPVTFYLKLHAAWSLTFTRDRYLGDRVWYGRSFA